MKKAISRNYHYLILILLFQLHARSQVSLTIYHGFVDPSIQSAWDQMLGEFRAARPDISLHSVFYGTEDQLVSRIQFWLHSNKLPDLLVWSPPYAASLVCETDLADMKNLMEPLRDNFPDWLYDIYAMKGKYFAVPLTINALGFIVNQSLFDSLHITVPATWSEWIETIRQFHSHHIPAIYIPDQNSEWTVWFWEILYWQCGGEFHIDQDYSVTLDSIPFIKSFQFYRELFRASCEISPERRLNEKNFLQRFLQGKIPMVIMGSWIEGELEHYNLMERVSVHYIPSPTGRENITNIGGESLSLLTTDGEKRKAAAEFYSFICKNGALARFNRKIGNFLMSPADENEANQFRKRFRSMLQNGKTRPVLPYYRSFSFTIGYHLNQYIQHEGDLPQMFTRIRDMLNQEAQLSRKKCLEKLH